MLSKLKKFVMTILVIIIMVMGAVMYYKDTSHKKEVTKLYNEIATQSVTIEVQKNVYRKQALVITSNKSLLDKIAKDSDDSIKSLKSELEKKDEDILSLTTAKLKWKKSYEAVIEAKQESIDPDVGSSSKDKRTKVSFSKDFGYIGVDGWTKTNPPTASIKISQRKPLSLTLTLSQDKKSRWTTTVATSDDNTKVDIEVSSVNPYMFDTKWYERISLDAGIQYAAGMYPYIGTSYSMDNGVYFGVGMWGTQDEVGVYGSIGYSWMPFRR